MKTNKKNLLKKQIIIISVSLLLIIIGFVAYGILNKDNSEKSEAPELLDGEVLLESQNRIFMFSPIDQEDIKSIFVHNKNGEFAFDYDAENDAFFIRGYKGTPYDQTKFISLENAARYPLINRRISDSADNYSSYGLADEQEPTWFEIKSKKGDTHKVYVGDMIQTGNGYYCRYEGRDAVYIFDSNTTNMGIFNLKILDFVTPLLSYPIDEGKYYYINNFTFQKDGDIFFSLRYLTDEERTAEASVDVYKMLVPENYVPSTDNVSKVLQLFCDFEGTEVLEISPVNGDTIADEILSKYNLVKPKYYLYYNYNNYNSFIRISEKNDDGTYYAYSELFNMVCLVDGAALDFLEWDFMEFVNSRIFQRIINQIDTIRVEGDGIDETFKLTGENKSLAVSLINHSGKMLDEAGIENFRNLYYKMQGLNIEGYAQSTSTDDHAMTLTVKTRVGNEYKYEFYNYSSRRCFFTINGVGEFYVLRDQVEMILADTQRIINGEEIDHNDKG